MSKDLISRSALLENYDLKNATKYGNETVEQQMNSYSTLMLYEVADMIEDAPAVDAEPVRHGVRTVYTIWHSSAWGEIHTKFECCGFDVRGTKKYNYCPNCGATMDGGAE